MEIAPDSGVSPTGIEPIKACLDDAANGFTRTVPSRQQLPNEERVAFRLCTEECRIFLRKIRIFHCEMRFNVDLLQETQTDFRALAAAFKPPAGISVFSAAYNTLYGQYLVISAHQVYTAIFLAAGALCVIAIIPALFVEGNRQDGQKESS